MSPSFTRSNSASRIGVAETPSRVAKYDTGWIVPASISPVTMLARIACRACSRKELGWSWLRRGAPAPVKSSRVATAFSASFIASICYIAYMRALHDSIATPLC